MDGDASGAVRSFDSARDGTVLGEGAVALVLERTDRARARGAAPELEIAGTALHPASGRSAAAALLERTGVVPEELDAVCADGKGTAHHDAGEARMLARLLAGAPVPVTSVRPVLGQIGAAGPLADLALCRRMFAHDLVPPVAGLRDPISNRLDFVVDAPRRVPMRTVLTAHHDFHGLAGAVLATRPDHD